MIKSKRELIKYTMNLTVYRLLWLRKKNVNTIMQFSETRKTGGALNGEEANVSYHPTTTIFLI